MNHKQNQNKLIFFLVTVNIIVSWLVLTKLTYIPNFLNLKFLNPTEKNFNKNNIESYISSNYRENYIWSGAMNLAWNDLTENILHEKLKLDTSDPKALEMTTKFNNSPFTKQDLNEKSYYIKSGYGQKTVDLINKESKQKFPSKSFSDLEDKLNPADIIAYAYFLKEVEYQTEFTEDQLQFNNETVKGFKASNEEQRNNIEILNYWNSDKFIITLKLKNKLDQIFIAKGFDMKDPTNVILEINKSQNRLPLEEDDIFSMPELHLDYQNEYTSLIGKQLANSKFKEYFIAKMSEKIKFDMDNKGARVENEAIIVMLKSLSFEKVYKLLILDKPFWVIMKQSNSQNPYFILGINNTGLMVK